MIRRKDILQHYLFQMLHVFIVRHLVNSVIKSTIAKLCNKTVGWLKYRVLKDHQNHLNYIEDTSVKNLVIAFGKI